MVKVEKNAVVDFNILGAQSLETLEAERESLFQGLTGAMLAAPRDNFMKLVAESGLSATLFEGDIARQGLFREIYKGLDEGQIEKPRTCISIEYLLLVLFEKNRLVTEVSGRQIDVDFSVTEADLRAVRRSGEIEYDFVSFQARVKRLAEVQKQYLISKYVLNFARDNRNRDNGVLQVDRLSDGVERIFDDLTPTKSRISELPDVLDQIISEVEDGGSHLQQIPTGIRSLDREMGGIDRGALTVVSGYAGSGKSLIALQLARNAVLQGHNVLFVPLEMTARSLSNRLIAGYVAEEDNVTMQDIKKAYNRSAQELDERSREVIRICEYVKEDLKKYGRFVFLEMEAFDTTREFISGVKKAHKEIPGGLDMVVLDYVGLLSPDDSRMETHVHLGDATVRFRKLMQKINAAGIMVAQLNEQLGRDGSAPVGKELENIQQYDRLAGSSEIKRHCDNLIKIYKPKQDSIADVHMPVSEVDKTEFVRIATDKMRENKNFSIYLKANFAKMRVEDMPEERSETDEIMDRLDEEDIEVDLDEGLDDIYSLDTGENFEEFPSEENSVPEEQLSITQEELHDESDRNNSIASEQTSPLPGGDDRNGETFGAKNSDTNGNVTDGNLNFGGNVQNVYTSNVGNIDEGRDTGHGGLVSREPLAAHFSDDNEDIAGTSDRISETEREPTMVQQNTFKKDSSFDGNINVFDDNTSVHLDDSQELFDDEPLDLYDDVEIDLDKPKRNPRFISQEEFTRLSKQIGEEERAKQAVLDKLKEQSWRKFEPLVPPDENESFEYSVERAYETVDFFAVHKEMAEQYGIGIDGELERLPFKRKYEIPTMGDRLLGFKEPRMVIENPGIDFNDVNLWLERKQDYSDSQEKVAPAVKKWAKKTGDNTNNSNSNSDSDDIIPFSQTVENDRKENIEGENSSDDKTSEFDPDYHTKYEREQKEKARLEQNQFKDSANSRVNRTVNIAQNAPIDTGDTTRVDTEKTGDNIEEEFILIPSEYTNNPNIIIDNNSGEYQKIGVKGKKPNIIYHSTRLEEERLTKKVELEFFVDIIKNFELGDTYTGGAITTSKYPAEFFAAQEIKDGNPIAQAYLKSVDDNKYLRNAYETSSDDILFSDMETEEKIGSAVQQTRAPLPIDWLADLKDISSIPVLDIEEIKARRENIEHDGEEKEIEYDATGNINSGADVIINIKNNSPLFEGRKFNDDGSVARESLDTTLTPEEKEIVEKHYEKNLPSVKSLPFMQDIRRLREMNLQGKEFDKNTFYQNG